jgi:hypothetical protein
MNFRHKVLHPHDSVRSSGMTPLKASRQQTHRPVIVETYNAHSVSNNDNKHMPTQLRLLIGTRVANGYIAMSMQKVVAYKKSLKF